MDHVLQVLPLYDALLLNQVQPMHDRTCQTFPPLQQDNMCCADQLRCHEGYAGLPWYAHKVFV